MTLSWWDRITPWDTENEKKLKEQQAAAEALAAQRAAERSSYQATSPTTAAPAAPSRSDFLSSWAEAAKPTTAAPAKPKPAVTPPVYGPQPKPATPASVWEDPVQAWRDSVAGVTAPTQEVTPRTTYQVAQPNFEVGLAFDRPDTGVAPLQSTAPISPTLQTGPEIGPARKPPAAWNAFSNAFEDWVAKPIGAAASAVGAPTALNKVGETLGETLPGWYQEQPAYLKAKADDEWRRSAGSNTGYDAFLDNAGQFLDQAFTVPAKSLLNAPIPGSGGALGLSGDIGFSDFAGALGGVLNQSGLNPLNPNTMTDAQREEIQRKQETGEAGFYEASGIKANLELAAQNRALIDALPPELKNAASMALTSTISGAENVRATIDAILGQPERVQQLYQLAEQAQTQGDALGAAEYSRQAEELANKQARDFVDENTNIWAEIVEGVLFDPTNLVGPIAEGLGITQEATTAAKNLQLFNMTPEAAQQAISAAMPDVQRVADKINLGNVTGNWWQRINPFALTPDSKAHATSNNIFRTASVLFGGVTDKVEAMAMAQNLVTNPAILVAEGAAGPGLLANPDFLRDLPILHVAQEQIQNMRSLLGEGAFNPVEFLSELDNVVYQAARRANGLDDTLTLPTGAVKTRLRRTAGGTGIIDYLDKAGKVIGSSEEMVYYNAQQELKALNNAIQGGGGAMSALRAHDQLQRAVMSDLWLNMRPAHWIRNALSATTTLLADNLYTLRPADDLLNAMTARFGGALPTQRLMEATGGVQEMTGSQSVFRKLGPLGAPIAALAEAGGKIWSGNTTLPLTGGRVAFGEQNFYLRAFNQPFERFLNDNWPKLVSGELLPTLQDLGIDPAMARRLQDLAVDAGVTGNKTDIMTALRSAVNQPAISPNLRELGISPDAFSLDAWKKINQLIQEGVPEDAAAIGQEIRAIAQQQMDNLNRLVNAAPPQPVRYAWTEAEQIEDGAEIIDSLTNAAKRAGVGIEQAKQEASTFVQRIINAEREQLATFRQELAANNNPSALNVAVDLWGQIDELKRVARAKVDQLGATANAANTAEAWQNKWSETQKIYTDLSQYVQRTIDQARTDVLALEGGKEVPRRYDFWNMVDRYLGFDEITTREARLGGMDLKAPSADPAWRQVVEANRAYVDASTAEAFQAFRRYANTDALDLIASAQRNIDRLGAQAAGYLAEMREQLAMGMISKDRYYGIRNTVWGQMFDNAVLVNKAATWEIVQNGLAAQTETMLRWSDDFAGGEFKLIAPGNDGLWTAKRLDDGTIHRFDDPLGKAALPKVPQEVVNDYYRIAGQADKIVEAEVADIAQEVAQTIPIPQTVDELMQMIQAGVTVPDDLIPAAVVDELMGGAAPPVRRLVSESSIPDLAAEAAAGATEARAAIRAEWDRIAKGEAGYLSIDRAIQSYTRNGIVNVPENKFEDLYGVTIAGQRIENQDDVNRLLQQYYDLGQARKQAAAAPAMRELDFAVPTIDFAARLAEMQKRLQNPYELIALAGDGFNPWGLLSDAPQDARQVFKLINEGVVNTRQVTPEVGDAAHYMAKNAQQAYQRIMQQLPELLAGTPNQLTQAQQLRVIDAINALAAKHDDILAAAVKTGQEVADFAMLNYNQRRNFDVLLQLAIPYHYFWSRSAGNWARRVAQKPSIANFYYEMQRGIDAQNERDNIPQHLQSTIPIPGTNYRIANPLPYMLPFAAYGPSSFVDPNEAQTDAGRWINTVVQWSPGLLPSLDLARKYFTTGSIGDVSIGDYVPQYKMAGYAYQGATGNILQGPLSYTDEFEYGRAGKQVSLANVRGEIDKNTALWGQDVGLQQQTGAAPLPEQPAGAADVWRQGAQASGWDRLLTTGAGYLTGLGLYPYRPEEQQIRAISGIRKDLGYDENSNLYGSQGAVNAFDEATGEVTDPYYAYRQLYPQDGSGYGKPIRPGEQAVNAEKKAAKAAINAQMGKDLDEFLKLNPDATNSDIYNFKKTYYDQIDALDQKFPSATQYPDRPPVTTDATGYMNYTPTDFYNNYSPEELLATAQEAAVYQAREELAGQKPVYPEGGTKEQINQYYKDKEAYDAALETRVQEYLDSSELLSSLVNARSVLPGPARPGEQYNPPPAGTASPLFPELGATGWDATKIKPVPPGQGAPSAADIIRQVAQGGQTDAEKAQREKNAKIAEEKRAAGKAKYEQSQAEWAARRSAVTGYFGEGGAKMWDEYYALPKGEARAEFMRNNPTMRAINLYAYNRAELQPGLDLLGDDAFGLWALAPAYGESPEAKAARSKYWDDNPKAFLFNSWLNGRPGAGGEGAQDGDGFTYNFGADYSQALELFGPDIWTIVEGYKRGWNKDIKRNYYDKHPQLSAFFDWWYGNGDGSVSAAGAGRSAGGGYRSYGGGGGGGYYDYSEQKRETPVNIQMPGSRGLSSALAGGGAGMPAAWRPSAGDMRWLEAGRNLAPGKPKESKVAWIRKTGGTY